MNQTLLFSVSLLAIAGLTANANNAKVVRNLNVDASQMSAQVVKNTQKAADVAKLRGEVVANQKGIKVVRANDGSLKRMILKASDKVNTMRLAKPSVMAATSTFSEGFEGWDGKTVDWIPSGWVDESKVGTDPNSADGNYTWEVSGGQPYYGVLPYEGEATAYIATAFALDMETMQIVYPQQDEWLITPAITPAAGDKFNFFLTYSPGWTLLDSEKAAAGIYEFTARNTDLEVLVSTDDGNEWTKLWNVIDEDAIKNYTVDELDATMNVFSTKCISLDIAEYAGKAVKFAFRYVGKAGMDMAIDNVSVGTMAPDASYAVPAGLWWAPDAFSGNYFPNAMTVAAYAPTLFKNTSIVPAESSWEYLTSVDGQTTTLLTSEETNLEVTYPFGVYEYPYLTSTVDGESATYTFGDWTNSQTGAETRAYLVAGGSPDAVIGKESALYGVCNYNFQSVESFAGIPDNTNANWQDWGRTEAKVVGFGAMMPQTNAPYTMSSVYVVFGTLTGDLTLPITVDVYKVVDNKIGEKLASATTVPQGNMDSYFVSDSYLVPFLLTQQMGELTQNVSLTIDSPIFIQINIPEGIQAAPLMTVSYDTPEFANSYAVYDDGNMFSINLLSLQDEQGGSMGIYGMCLTTDATFTWLRSTDGDYKFEVPNEGGSKTFNIDAYYLPEGWSIEDTGDALYDWVEPTTNYDEATGAMSLTFTVTELPADAVGRLTDVTVSIPGASAVFRIAQGDVSGVEGVVAPAVIVTVENGNFVVNGSEVSSVDVYNIAGQRVASAAIQGETVIDGQNLAKGVYILKFNNNKTVKIVK